MSVKAKDTRRVRMEDSNTEDMYEEEEVYNNESEEGIFYGDNATLYRTLAALAGAVAIVGSRWVFGDLDYDTESDYYLGATYRDNIWTKWFPTSNLVVFTALNVWGFWFVNWVTYKSEKPFNAHNTCSSAALPWLVMLSPVLFFFSGMYAMRARRQNWASCDGLDPNDYVYDLH